MSRARRSGASATRIPIDGLCRRIVVDRQPSVWRNWEGEREALLRAAAESWIPREDLRQFLNSLPGPKLRATDVTERLRAIHEEPYSSYPEVAEGTEMPAIIGALQVLVEQEGERLRHKAKAAYRERQKEEQEALEHRFLSGADCKWTPVGGSKALYVRKSGRAYRLSPIKDKRWALFRIGDVDDKGKLVGTYGSRGDASKALAKLAYEPEPRW